MNEAVPICGECGARYVDGKFIEPHKDYCSLYVKPPPIKRPARSERVHALLMTSNVVPVPKPRMTQRDKWEHRPSVVRYRAFKDELRKDAIRYGYDADSMDVFSIDVMVAIKIPDSWSKKKKTEMVGKPHRQTPDADNILKGVCDTLLKNDSGVWSKKIVKHWSETPGLTIMIEYYEV